MEIGVSLHYEALEHEAFLVTTKMTVAVGD